MAESDYLYPTGTYQVRPFGVGYETITAALAFPPPDMVAAEEAWEADVVNLDSDIYKPSPPD